MSKRKASNIITLVIIAVIIASGIIAAGAVKGWFDRSDGRAVLCDITGIVYIQRGEAVYPAKGEAVLRSGDKIFSRSGAKAKIKLDDASYAVISENTSVQVSEPYIKSFSLNITDGEIFTAAASLPIALGFGGCEFTANNSVLSLTVSDNFQKINIYSGVFSGFSAGQTVSMQSGELSAERLYAENLTAFTKSQLILANKISETCFSDSELSDSPQISDIICPSETGSLCTLTIRCDAVFESNNLPEPVKAEFIPDDGFILRDVKIGVEDGETVFDILKKACLYFDIQLQYEETPFYGSVYIEGINQLFEFDCGSESGWVYKVDGKVQSKGCSSYALLGGEYIEWCYTVSGFGADVGG